MIDPFDRPRPGPMTFETGDVVILCEGFDECAVLRKLCAGWARQPRMGVCESGKNVQEEVNGLAYQVRMRGIAAIGFVFDAEDSRSDKQKEIKRWLEAAGFTPPVQSMRLKESRLAGVSVKTAYLINPHGKNRGAIESYFLPQVRSTDQWSCINGLLRCYSSQCPTSVLKEKVILRTFIAHKNGRNTGLNAAFNARILTVEDSNLDPLRRFLTLLRSTATV